jgi:hypothetical protein
MAEVARHEGATPTFGQSPFALIRGRNFERSLFRDNAERLINELRRHGVVPDGASGLADFRLRMNGGSRIRSLDEAIEETLAHLTNLANVATGTEAILAGATLRIPKGIMLPEAILIVDAIAVDTSQVPIKVYVGEIKTYPDRGGYTDPQELAVARAQAGIYVHALDVVLAENGMSGALDVSRSGFLVLTRPGSNYPSVRANEDLRYQAERAKHGFELLEAAAQALPPDRWCSGGSPDEGLIEAVTGARTRYSENCLSFCDRASTCYSKAMSAGDPVVLGESVQQLLGVADLNVAVRLLKGHNPTGPIEVELKERINTIRGVAST